MSETPKRPPGDLALQGEYLEAMETISARLMQQLPDNDELWACLGQAETLLMEAQLTQTPLHQLLGKGGVAAFCQSIIDEKKQMAPDGRQSSPNKGKKSPNVAPRTQNAQIRRKKNILTAAIVVLWCLVVAALIGQYIGFWPYFFGDNTYYLEELHNFTPSVTPLEDSNTEATLPLRLHGATGETLYTNGDYRIYISDIGYDDDALSTEKGGLRRWWVELSYTKQVGFSNVSYVEPPESGQAFVTLADGSTHQQSLYFQGELHDPVGISCIRLYFLELPKDTDFKEGSARITFDSATLVRWTRTGVGPRAK